MQVRLERKLNEEEDKTSEKARRGQIPSPPGSLSCFSVGPVSLKISLPLHGACVVPAGFVRASVHWRVSPHWTRKAAWHLNLCFVLHNLGTTPVRVFDFVFATVAVVTVSMGVHLFRSRTRDWFHKRYFLIDMTTLFYYSERIQRAGYQWWNHNVLPSIHQSA